MGMSGPIGLRYEAVIGFAHLGGPLSPDAAGLLSLCLPVAEGHLLRAIRKNRED